MPHNKFARFLIGLVLVLAVLAGGFALALSSAPTWGATPAEAARSLPGDALTPRPAVSWTNAITLNAPPEQVWPWIAQFGDRRGGFYSYTFIENIISGSSDYHNADRVLPELQNPQPGERLIMDMIRIYEVKPAQYFLANAPADSALGWSWVWALTPLKNNQTRLVVRLRIQPPAEMGENPILSTTIAASAFVMEKGMLQGLKERAEGSTAPGPNEPLEIGVWLVGLLAGLAASVLFIIQRSWQLPLLAVVSLLVFTYVQPAIWLRALIDLALAAGVVLSRRK
jgi:hypothetical protein